MESQQPQQILFYSTKSKETGYLSNFYKAGFAVDNKYYKTSEHYFQSEKFDNVEIQEEIRNESSGSAAAKMGRSRKYPIKENWDYIRDDIMRKAVFEKFSQNADIKEKLLNTYPHTLIEHTNKDKYWADNGDGSGENKLGLILMEVRELLMN